MRLRVAVTTTVLTLFAGMAAPAQAQTFLMTMQGFLDSRSALIQGSTTTPLANASPFTFMATFDKSSPNLVAPLPFPGFVAYSPSAAQFIIGGQTFAMQPFDGLHLNGIGVAIFDATTPFGPPGRYAAGFIQDPLADGAGIVADFAGASPAFTLGLTGVVPTAFTGFVGVGVSSGVCTAGTPAACQAHDQRPIPLTLASQPYALLLGNYEADAAPGFSYSVTITAVPEPSSLVLVAIGSIGLVVIARRCIRRQ